MSKAVPDVVRKEVLATVRIELERMFTVLFNAYYGQTHKHHKVVALRVEASLKKWLELAEQNEME